MIDKEKISLDWINKVAKENKATDKILVEKVIRALLLLEGLALISGNNTDCTSVIVQLHWTKQKYHRHYTIIKKHEL